MNRKAFSLIELMVVVALVAILSTIAVSSYKVYVVKAKINTAVNLLSRIVDQQVEQAIITGSYASCITVNGVSFCNFQWANVNFGPIAWLSIANYYGTMAFTASISGLSGLPGYVDPTSINSQYAAYSWVSMIAYIQSNGVVVKYCGYYYPPSSTPYDIPLTYLPASCQTAGIVS